MERGDPSTGDLMNDLPRVLLENYLMLSAALENQNLGRLQDMLQYQQKVHRNLLDVVQQIEDAPAVAMTTTQQPIPLEQSHQQQIAAEQQTLQELPEAQQTHLESPTAAAVAPHEQPHTALTAFQPPEQPQQQQQKRRQSPPAWLSSVNQPVHTLLEQLGLLQFEQVLEQQHVDLAALQLMEERHMRELGLPLGAVVKIKAALAAQQHVQQQQQS